MSGGMKIPLPKFPVYEPSRPRPLVPQENRDAAVLLLLQLYNDYPLRSGEMRLLEERQRLIRYASVGWFDLLDRDCEGMAFPHETLRSALALLR